MQRWQAQFWRKCSGEDLVQRLAIAGGPAQHIERLLYEFAQRNLMQALGGGIDRGQGRFNRQGVAILQHPAFRVHHLQLLCATPHFSKTAHTPARRQTQLLFSIEVKKSERQFGVLVFDADQQRAPASELHLTCKDRALDHAFHARKHLSQRRDSRAVLIAQREVVEQVANRAEPEFLEAHAHPRPNPLQARDRIIQRGGDAVGRRLQRQRIASISMCAPRGRADTCTVARAG